MGISNTLVLANPGSGQVKASVLVDVRKVSKKTQGIVDRSYPIVGLDTLDEFKRHIGNPREIVGESFLSKRWRAVFGQ